MIKSSDIELPTEQDVQCRIRNAEKLFADEGVFIRSIIRYAIKDHEPAEEMYQELFLFFVRKPLPPDIHNVRAFLYRIIIDKAKDYYRSQVRYVSNLKKYAEIRQHLNSYQDNEKIDNERFNKLYELIQRHLSNKEALAIMLRYNQNFDVQETAQRMNVNPRTVSRYVSVGLKKIRDVIKSGARNI